MTLRAGHTYRIYDGSRLTVAIGGSYICDGSHRRPSVSIIDRRRNYRRVTLPLPHVRFRRCYKLRHVGGLKWYRLWHRAIRHICAAPRTSAGGAR